MNLAQLPVPIVGLPGSKKVSAKAALAANAGASVIANIAVPVNCMVIASVLVRAAAGALSRVAVTADAGADTLTAAAGHGLVTGMAGYVVGTGQPGGVTASTLYYFNVSTDTVKIYNTQANAVANGATGLVDITSVGAGVYIEATTLSAAYIATVAACNKNGTTALLGSADLIAFEDVAGWALTFTANNTTDVLEVKGTPDTVLATTFEVVGDVVTLSLAV